MSGRDSAGSRGRYDWNGAVLKETSSGKVIPLRESYLKEFPRSSRNHGAYLGKRQGLRVAGGQWGQERTSNPEHAQTRDKGLVHASSMLIQHSQ